VIESTVIVFPSTFPLMVTFCPASLSNWLLSPFRMYTLSPLASGKVRPLLDAFAGTLCRGLTLHHVMRATRGIGHGPGDGLAGLGECCSDREHG
jgi:hypothetical protein